MANKIFDYINYELVFSNGVKIIGDCSYVSSHLTDFDDPKLSISQYQPEIVKKYMAEHNLEIKDLATLEE